MRSNIGEGRNYAFVLIFLDLCHVRCACMAGQKVLNERSIFCLKGDSSGLRPTLPCVLHFSVSVGPLCKQLILSIAATLIQVTTSFKCQSKIG
jgi:hypothetical protein